MQFCTKRKRLGVRGGVLRVYFTQTRIAIYVLSPLRACGIRLMLYFFGYLLRHHTRPSSAEGMTIVVATPYLDEAEGCDRVALKS
jgi:hypothetical protein